MNPITEALGTLAKIVAAWLLIVGALVSFTMGVLDIALHLHAGSYVVTNLSLLSFSVTSIAILAAVLIVKHD